jgi:hypothetical protein
MLDGVEDLTAIVSSILLEDVERDETIVLEFASTMSDSLDVRPG